MSTLTRRGFLTGAGLVVGAGAGHLFGTRFKDSAGAFLRPPGARLEEDFLASCVRCGQCVEACPYGTLHLVNGYGGAATGTPYLVARKVPCYLCRDHQQFKCIVACPTGALQPVASIADIRMGTAFINQDTCLAWQGLMCRGCLYACPFPEKAITFDEFYRPVIHEDACIGCGLCECACLTDPSSIPIRPAGAKIRTNQPSSGGAVMS